MRDNEKQHINKYRDTYKSFARYLHSKVGQLWDNVFSEICKIADVRSPVGRSLRDRIKWEVDTDVVIGDDGYPYEPQAHYGQYHRIRGLYVHPDTGILLKAPNYERILPKKEVDHIHLENGHNYAKLAGIWYETWETEVPSYTWLRKHLEPEHPITNPRIQAYRTVYHKRQLNTKEIKNLKKSLL